MALFERGPQGPAGPPGKVVVPGNDGEVLVNLEGTLSATAKLKRVDSEIHHAGTPQHNEEWSNFYAGGDSFARSQWHDVTTEDATPTTIGTISIPVAEHGNGIITVIAEMSISYDDGGDTVGGNRAAKAVFRRSSGVLTRIGIENLSSSNFWEGDPIGGLDIDVVDNDSVKIEGTGIAAPSVHVIFSKKP